MRKALARTVCVLYLAALFVILVVPSAGAYIDPGSGSFIFQAAVGAAMAVGLTAKVFWRRIVSFFTRRRAQDG